MPDVLDDVYSMQHGEHRVFHGSQGTTHVVSHYADDPENGHYAVTGSNGTFETFSYATGELFKSEAAAQVTRNLEDAWTDAHIHGRVVHPRNGRIGL